MRYHGRGQSSVQDQMMQVVTQIEQEGVLGVVVMEEDK